MENPTSRNPLYTIAAIAVILFSATGVATMMGWVPSSHSKVADAGSPTEASAVATPSTALPAPVSPVPQSAMSAPIPASYASPRVEEAPPEHEHHPHRAEKHRPVQVANAGLPPPSDAAAAPAGMPPPGVTSAGPILPAPVTAAPVCENCGKVRSVEQQVVKGEGSGLGAVAGGVLGAVVGHQVGQGNGNTLATLLGAGGGALAGNAVEKNSKATTQWNVLVDMAQGGTRSFHFNHDPGFASGDAVRVSNGQLVSAQ